MKKSSSFWAVIMKLGSKLISMSAKGLKLYLAIGSAAAYTYLYGWRFAIAIMVLLFVHESGHVWAMKRKGIPTKGFYFIPFIGGAAVPDRSFISRSEEYYVAIMGPIWGYLLSLLMMFIYYLTKEPLFGVIASWMALINLFNLLPVNPLDGGRMLKSILFSINDKIGRIFLYSGLIISTIFLIYFKIYIFALILLVSGIELYFSSKSKRLDKLLEDDIKYGYEKSKEVIEYERIQNMPKIPKKYLYLYVLSYVLITLLLYSIMYLMNGIQGAEIAKELIYG